MPEEQAKPIESDEVVIDHPAIQKGDVKFMSKDGWNNPAPKKVKIVTEAIKDFVSGLIIAVGASDLFSGYQSKAICFVLGIVGLLCGVISRATGVKPSNNEQEK